MKRPRAQSGVAGLATDRFNDQETGIALIGDTPDFGASLDELFTGRYAFSKACGLHPATVMAWLKGDQIPSLKAVLLISYRFGIPAHRLLFERVDTSTSFTSGEC